MRKKLIALMFAATLPAVAMAALPQGGPDQGPGFGRGEMMEHGHRGGPDLFGRLDLNREQRQQIGKLMGEQMKQRHEITEAFLKKLPAADQKALQDQLKASEDKSRADVRAVLTPDQQKQFDEQQKKQEQRRAEWAEFQAWKAQKDKKAQ
ncbi:Spy/CpxP family protein refolding chaperone [Pseudomonas sp. NPDC007930]|uniref:Spy/CpxP family protein refolding chaperone n=1 Tax=Pseudomonas sp. NPDC007930 TaxID=3364417 RepID=UPI0036E9E9DB